ncbi:MAG TPA: glycosyltransferase, partial [Acidimicrobiales bacterium]|nr:glycosyltransferase [Acidimicrobiales bacterium]
LRVEPGEAVAAALRGRPAVLRHHDLPWHRPQLAHLPPPPDDAVWLHVCTSDHSRLELAARGIGARTLRNRFETAPAPGDRARMRRALGVAAEERLILQPTRAIARKNVRAGIDLAAATGSVYWLLGRAEDGYETELDELFSRARRSGVPLRHRWPPTAEADADPPLSMADAYAGCDVVALPSTWEGFGNPALESATHGRPLVIGDYPASRELRAFGFHWFGPEDHRLVADFLAQPDDRLLAANAAVARRHFDLAALPGELEALLSDLRQPLRGVSGNP